MFTGTIRDLQNDWLPTTKESGSTNPLGEKLSASHLISVPMAVDAPPARTAIPVPCAVTPPMNVPIVSPEFMFPIITKLKPDAWKIAFEHAGTLLEFSDVPEGLWNGFFVGLENFELSCTSIPENHYTLQDNEELVVKKYNEKIALRRVSHGYEPTTLFSLIGHFCTAPLAVIDQNGEKQHIIVNHLYPRTKNSITLDSLKDISTQNQILGPTVTSINTIIDSTKFQCAWGFFLECYLLVADAIDGSQAAVFDVDSAFCNIPIHPSAHCFLVIMIRGQIHLDHVLNFGASPSPGIFGRVADAAVRIFLSCGMDAVIKWVDNFIFFCYPLGPQQRDAYDFHYSSTHCILAFSVHLGVSLFFQGPQAHSDTHKHT